MATKKQTFNVKGVELTETLKKVYDFMPDNEPITSDKIVIEGLSQKSIQSSLARLDTVCGLITSQKSVKGTSYIVNKDMLESVDLSKITDKEKSVLNACKDLESNFTYNDIRVDNMTPKAIIATLARLNTTYGVLDKKVSSGKTTYLKGE